MHVHRGWQRCIHISSALRRSSFETGVEWERHTYSYHIGTVTKRTVAAPTFFVSLYSKASHCSSNKSIKRIGLNWIKRCQTNVQSYEHNDIMNPGCSKSSFVGVISHCDVKRFHIAWFYLSLEKPRWPGKRNLGVRSEGRGFQSRSLIFLFENMYVRLNTCLKLWRKT